MIEPGLGLDQPLCCPFCGRDPYVDSVRAEHGYRPGRQFIRCRTCHISLVTLVDEEWELTDEPAAHEYARIDVLQRWNTRYPYKEDE